MEFLELGRIVAITRVPFNILSLDYSKFVSIAS
jgi:hypothetical protein